MRFFLLFYNYLSYYSIHYFIIKFIILLNNSLFYNQTPISIACEHNFEEIARILLENGADPNIGSIIYNFIQLFINLHLDLLSIYVIHLNVIQFIIQLCNSSIVYYILH